MLVQGDRAAGQVCHVVFGAVRHERVAYQADEPPRPGVGEDTLRPGTVLVQRPGLEAEGDRNAHAGSGVSTLPKRGGARRYAPRTLRRHLEAEVTCVAQRREVSVDTTRCRCACSHREKVRTALSETPVTRAFSWALRAVSSLCRAALLAFWAASWACSVDGDDAPLSPPADLSAPAPAAAPSLPPAWASPSLDDAPPSLAARRAARALRMSPALRRSLPLLVADTSHASSRRGNHARGALTHTHATAMAEPASYEVGVEAAADDAVSGDPNALLNLSRSANNLRLHTNSGSGALLSEEEVPVDLARAAQTVAARVAAARAGASAAAAAPPVALSGSLTPSGLMLPSGVGGAVRVGNAAGTSRLLPNGLPYVSSREQLRGGEDGGDASSDADSATVAVASANSGRGSGGGGVGSAQGTGQALDGALALAVLPRQYEASSGGGTLALVQQRQQEAHALAAATEERLHESAVAGIAKVLEAMRDHLWMPAVQEAGLQALSNLALKMGTTRVPAVAADAVRACVAAMGAHPSIVPIQEHALTALRAFCKLADAEDIFDVGVEAVVALALAHEGLAPLQELSMRTLADLLDQEDFSLRSVDKALALGTLEVIACAMTTHSSIASLQEKCLDVVLKMLSTNPGIKDEHKARAVSAGFVGCALAALRQHLESSHVLILACKVLKILTTANDEAASTAAASGCAEAIVVAMRAHRGDATLAEAGAAAMRTLLASPAGKARAVTGGALETLCLAMFAFPDNRGVQAACAGTLKSLAVHPSARTRTATAAALEGLVQALRAFGSGRAGDQAAAGDGVAVRVAADACGALANFMVDSPVNQERVAGAGGIEAVVETMQAHVAGSSDVAEAGCAALWAIATDSDDQTLIQLATAGGCDALVASIRCHPDDVSLHCLAGAALCAICTLAKTANAAAAAGAVDTVLESLRRHGQSAALQEGLFKVLDTMCKHGGDKISAAVAAEGGHLVIQAAVTTRFPKNDAVLKAAESLNVRLRPHAWQGRGSRLLA